MTRAPPSTASRAAPQTALSASPPADDVIIVARTEEDVSALELWVYEAGDENDAESNLYVHHDVLLPGARPVAHAQCSPGVPGRRG